MTLQEMGHMCPGKAEYEVSQTKGEAIISRTDVDTHEGQQMHMFLKNTGNRKKSRNNDTQKCHKNTFIFVTQTKNSLTFNGMCMWKVN
jgi:uncharacterized protein Veg